MELSSPQRAKLRCLGQRLEPLVTVGKQGLTEALITEFIAALHRTELVKVRFKAFKEEKEVLAQELARRGQCELITLVGHVAVFYRPNQDPQQRRIVISST